jgi:hypothetical protein
MHSENEKLIVGYGPLAAFLTEEGYPTSKSTMSKYCSPAINIGPPVEGFWGKLPAFKPSRAIAWAKARMRPADEARSRLSAAGDPAASGVCDGVPTAAQEAPAQPLPSEGARDSRAPDKRTSKPPRHHSEAIAGA